VLFKNLQPGFQTYFRMKRHSHHTPENVKDSSQSLALAFILNLIFFVVEIIGGLLTNSIAILSDAVHDLGDTVTVGFSWLMERYAKKKATDKLTFGYRRFSLVGAITSSFVLLLGSVFILSQTIPRLFNPESVHPEGMLGLAILGILINGIAVFRLRKGEKINERVIFLHLMEDVLGWSAVLIISILLLFFDMLILDPLLSIVITIFIVSKIIPNIKNILKIFLQYSPDDLDIQKIKELLMRNDFIDNVHDIHLWSLDGRFTVLSCHIASNKDLSLTEIEKEKINIKRALNELGIEHITLEFEPNSKICKDCDL
jgi:cobalt-zinc-cadmium efflux system protein